MRQEINLYLSLVHYNWLASGNMLQYGSSYIKLYMLCVVL